MKTYNCLIVDDEALARKLLNEYAKLIPELNLVKLFDNAVEVVSFVKHNAIDIIFLDINMPDLSGIDLIKMLPNPKPVIVLSTANSEYAIEGYQLQITDYLLKPIPFDRFFSAVQKAIKKIDSAPEKVTHEMEKEFLFCKVYNKIVRINIADILFVESALEYVKIVTDEKSYLTFSSLHNLFESLPKKDFFQVHRSYVVNLKKIEWVEGNQIKIRDTDIPISKAQKQGFLKAIHQ